MAGHSKWHNIKHRKAAVDAKRGKMWSKCAKAVMVAAKHGGPDPEANLALRYAIDEARYANMPRDTIERAIKKGSGEIGGESWENIRYEGYGPNGAAIVVDALTNNRTRTAVDVRNAFAKHGGNLGTNGCVSFIFQTRGRISLPAASVTEDALMELAAAAGAEDVTPPDPAIDEQSERFWTVLTAPTDFGAVKQAIESAGLTILDAGLELIPNTFSRLTGDNARSMIKLVDLLEDNDDVQKVYHNADIPESELQEITGA